MSTTLFADCSALATRDDLAAYIELVNKTTSFNPQLLNACKSNICIAMWGDGNADISGIGMVVGYFFQAILGAVFTIAFAFLSPTFTKRSHSRSSYLLTEAFKSFFNCAVFFTASIQISCVVVLVRRDFAISANGLGGLTTQITWAVALLCMLPLLYPMVILSYVDRERSNYRFFLFCACWLPFFYVFISQMIGSYAPSQIGEGAAEGGDTIATTPQWGDLQDLCLKGLNILSEAEHNALSGFGAAGSMLVTSYGLGYLLWFIGSKQWPKKAARFHDKVSRLALKGRDTVFIFGMVMIGLVLCIPLMWGVLRLRGVQKALAGNTRNVYVDNQWTFGQVVAITLFAPVFTDTGYLLMTE